FVSQGLEWFLVACETGVEQLPHFLKEPAPKHFCRAMLYRLGEPVAWRREADKQRAEPLERFGGGGRRTRGPGQNANLESASQLLYVARMDSGGSRGFEAGEEAVECARTPALPGR